MKTTIKHLLLLTAVIFSAQLWATTYTYTGSWSPSNPQSATLVSGDIINVATGTFSQVGSFVIPAGVEVTVSTVAFWKVQKNDTLTNNSNSFTVVGELIASKSNIGGVVINNGSITVIGILKVINEGSLTNNGTIIVDASGEIRLNGTGSFVNNGTVAMNGFLNVKNNSVFTNDGTVVGTGTIKVKKDSSFVNNGNVNGCTGSTCVTKNSSPIDLGASIGAPNVTSFIIWNGTNFLSLEGIVVVPDSTMALVLQANLSLTTNQNVEVGILYTEDFLTPSGAYPIYTMQVINNSSITVASFIDNKSTITVESGGSLVQNSIDNNNIGVGNYIINQSGGQTNNMAYNIWSSPINNADLISVFPSTNPCGMYVFNASTQEWKYDFSTASTYTCNGNSGVDFTGFTYTDGAADGLMDAGRGYFIPGDGTSNEKTYSGTINNGTIPVTVYSTNVDTTGTGWDGNDWNLIGNPYPSGVDPSLFWAANSGNLTDGLYFWDEATTDYVVWNATGGTTPVGFEVAVGQGFYVLTDDAVITDGTSGTISFENSMRTNTGGDFYKKENEKNTYVSMSISTPNGEVNQIVVGSSEQATNGFDKLYDAHKLSGNPNIRFASLLNNQEFIIQSVAPIRLGKSKVVALSVFTAETGIHTFSENNRESIPNGMEVYLKDNKTDVLHDLTRGDYTVNLDANQTYDSRFELIFVNNGVVNDDSAADVDEDDSSADVVTGLETIDMSDFTLLNEANAYTLYNANGIKGDVQVISITGTVVWTKSGVSATSLPIELNGLSSGIYFIQVINNNERVYTNKIVNP